MFKVATLLVAAAWFGAANAHVAPYAKGMYCLNGATGASDLNSYSIVTPLYQLNFQDWWFHHVNHCDEYPPPEGEFLELPAGGSFTVEIASNRAKTTMSYNGRDTSAWPDGANYPEDYHVDSCITSPNLHTQDQAHAAGTAFAISYTSDIKAVTPENLVVFSIRYHTPWKRVTVYDVPADMPPCPAGGCICAWGWVPNGCGQPNMYHQPFKCQVTNSKSNTPLAAPKPPVWCEGNPDACTKGAKQMVYWNQNERNNIFVDGLDAAGEPKSPGYNMKLGFVDGAQNDIFAGPASGGGSPPTPNPPSTPPNNGSGNTGSGTPGGSGSGSGSSGGSGTGTGTGTSGGSGTGTGTGSSGGTGSGNGPPPDSGSGSGSNTSTTSSSAPTSTPIKNNAPSCQKRRRRRSASTLAKKSVLGEGVTAHRRRRPSPEW